MYHYKVIESRIDGDSGGGCAMKLSQHNIKSRTHKYMQELRNIGISYTNSQVLDKEL